MHQSYDSYNYQRIHVLISNAAIPLLSITITHI